jgi:hypothetical protein
MALSGHRERGFYGSSYTVKAHIGIEDLRFRADQLVRNETDVVRHQLMRNGIDLYVGHGAFLDPHTVVVDDLGGHGRQTLTARHIVIATGTTAARDDHIPFDGRRILTSDDAVTLDRLPRTLAVIGAGVIGLEYAAMFASLGVRVTLIDKRPRLLPYVDAEIMDALAFQPAAQPDDALARRGGQRPRPRRRRRGQGPHPPRQRQAHHRREGALLDRPRRRDGDPEPRGRRAERGRAGTARRRRALPHRRAAQATGPAS